MYPARKLLSNLFHNKLLCRYTMTSTKKNLIALLLAKVNHDPEDLKIVEKLVVEAKNQDAKMIFLPEFSGLMEMIKKRNVSPLKLKPEELVKWSCNLAKNNNIWISFGGIPILDPISLKWNMTHMIMDDFGNITAEYVKTHLCDLKNKKMEEPRFLNFGKTFIPPVRTPCGMTSLASSYDVRFPEMSVLQRRSGAEILTFPLSNVKNMNWKTLVRARAIDSQCYVVAASSFFNAIHTSNTAYGMVVNPEGNIIAECKTKDEVAVVDIDLTYLENIRKSLPLMVHRRLRLYSLYPNKRDVDKPWNVELLPNPSIFCQHKFGHVFVPGACIVFKTYSTFVCVNKKPVSPNHLLVINDRPAENLKDLNLSEICDVAQSVLLSIILLQFVRMPTDIQISIQDGVHSGQTINHLHVHLVPTMPTFRINKVDQNKGIQWRNESDMEMEGHMLRSVGEDVLPNKMNDFLSQPPRVVEIKKACDDSIYTIIKTNFKPKLALFSTDLFNVAAAPAPILEGHTLLAFNNKSTKGFKYLTAEEVSNLFQCLQIVEKILMKIFNTKSVTISWNIRYLGNISQILFHVIPRKAGDLSENDQIYELMRDYEENLKIVPVSKANTPSWMKEFVDNLPLQ